MEALPRVFNRLGNDEKKNMNERKGCTTDSLTPVEKEELRLALTEASDYFDVPLEDVDSRSKKQVHVNPRHCAIWALLTIFNWKSSKLCVAFDMNRRNLTSIRKKLDGKDKVKTGTILVHPKDLYNYMELMKKKQAEL